MGQIFLYRGEIAQQLAERSARQGRIAFSRVLLKLFSAELSTLHRFGQAHQPGLILLQAIEFVGERCFLGLQGRGLLQRFHEAVALAEIGELLL